MAKPNKEDKQLIDAVYRAVRQQDVDTLETLFKEGLDPDLKLSKWMGSRRAVTLAVAFDDPAVFDLCVRYGADMNIPSVGHNNPLFLSVEAQDKRGVTRALAAGADVSKTFDRRAKEGGHVMHAAAAGGDPAIMEMLLAAGGWRNIEQKNNFGVTPLKMVSNAVLHPDNPAADSSVNQKRMATYDILQHYRDLPRLDFESKSFSKASLFAADAQGHCPLEHPETWERWDDVLAVLAEKGESISKADLQRKNAAGTPWLERSVSCFALDKVLAGLHANNETLGAKELLVDGGASPLLALARDYRQSGKLFNAANCRDWTREELGNISGQLDAYEKTAFIPQMNQLRILVGQQDSLRQQAGRGR